jgi:hypothetical protein
MLVERIIKKGIGKRRERNGKRRRKEREKGRKRIGGELDSPIKQS